MVILKMVSSNVSKVPTTEWVLSKAGPSLSVDQQSGSTETTRGTPSWANVSVSKLTRKLAAYTRHE